MIKKKSVAVVGANGFVGNALCEALAKHPEYELVRVTRENYEAMKSGSYDIVINAAMPSGRFWAKNNPEEDYEETVLRTAALLKWNALKLVQISTVSARCDTASVYGRHKAEAEKLCDPKRDLILRLSAMYGPSLIKGALVDILNRSKVFVSGDSRYPFAPLSFISDWISRNLHRTGLVEVGAKNTVTLKEVARHLGETIEFEGPADHQDIRHPEADYPDARGVFDFMDSMRTKRK